jgi:PAS domain S-box-containing protein
VLRSDLKLVAIPSIRSRLVVLVLACVFPAAIMVGSLISYQYQREHAQFRSNAITTARTMAFAVDQRLLVAKAGLSALATSRSLRDRDFANFYDEAKATLPELNAENIALLRRDGEMELNTLKPFGSPMPANRASQLTQAAKSGNPVFADLFMGAVAGNFRVAVGVPVIHDGKVAYSINASITPERLQAILLQQRLPADWIAAIVDNAGTIVARTRDQKRLVGVKVVPAVAKRMNEVAEDAIETTTLEGIPALAAFSRSGLSGWTVVIGIPRDSLTAVLWRSMLWLGIGTLLLLGFTIALAWALGNSIVRTTRDLVAPALALGSGELLSTPLTQPSFREAAQLGQALEQAAGLLSDANRALVRSEARLSTILESAMDSVIVIDEDHKVIMFNAAAETLFCYSRKEALGASIAQFLPHRFRDSLATRIDNFGRQGAPTGRTGPDEPLVGLRRSGEEFPIDAAISQFIESGRRIYTLIVRDVTERVRTHDELLRSNLDLQQFAFVASHDLRTPLRSIMGYVHLLEKRYGPGLDPKALDLIHHASNAVQTLDHLTDDLLSYARLDAQVKPFTAIDCNEVLADTLQLMDAAIIESGASISAGPLPVVLGDRGQLVQLFQNLLANSIKYCEGHAPQIRITSELDADAVWTISVADNGIGIEAKHHERVFEVFKRLHTAQEYRGTGIGLAVCRRIVGRHGGRIWVTSAARQGSTFSFTIPIISELHHDQAT